MSCCSEYVDIGCESFCGSISLGYNATQTGVHTIEVYHSNGARWTWTETYTIGNDMALTANRLNESKVNDIRIKQPDGTYYAFDTGIDCARVTTEVHYLVT